jgi:hypothetical protein
LVVGEENEEEVGEGLVEVGRKGAGERVFLELDLLQGLDGGQVGQVT